MDHSFKSNLPKSHVNLTYLLITLEFVKYRNGHDAVIYLLINLQV